MAAAATPAAVVIGTPAMAKETISSVSSSIEENPALLEAYDRLNVARLERREAKDALEWLADEWRHLWPLAPEELLGGANADRHPGPNDDAERDIIGRHIKRDVTTLTKRLSPKFRQGHPEGVCFSVLTWEEADKHIEYWASLKPKGRTERALAKNIANREAAIVEARHKRKLAQKYFQETTALRQEAGVDQAIQRVTQAETAVLVACSDISQIPALTPNGLRIKAEAIMASGVFQTVKNSNGLLGEMARFVQSVINVAPTLAAAA
ncbi:hypothetical protein [Rhizobium sullae]|uniref:hypothetical protein n=1 Tax=Rhizobium sullae TaxID=50338 RepID=UPI0018E2591A|nr:hypothetical protein [Rhizobium sullae]